MSDTNIDRSIEEFCGNFLSFSVNFSSWGAPTIEIEMLAGSNASVNSNALSSAENILKDYFPFVKTSNFQLANREVKKSSSGKIIAERWVDKFWWYANGKFVGLTNTIGGDLMLGKEYHSVSGVYGNNRSVPNNYTMSDNFLRAHHRELRSGMCAFQSNAGWWSKSCKCSGFANEEALNNWRRAPGLENPEITLGDMYYTWPEFLLSSGLRSSDVSKITNNGEPIIASGSQVTNIATGVFNNTGSYYSVINSIVNTFGWTYVPSCALGGHAFINPTSDFGKIDVLTNAGISVPNNAVAASEVRDYSAGYAQGSFLSIKRPGREQDVDKTEQQQAPSTRYCAHSEYEPGEKTLKTVDVLSKVSSSGLEINAADCIWRFVSDFPIFYELGLAMWIEENGTKAEGDKGLWLRGIYDKAPDDYVFYTNCDGITKINPIEILGSLWEGPVYSFGDFLAGTIDEAIRKALDDISIAGKIEVLMSNLNRFAFTDEIGRSGEPISMSGDVVNSDANGYKKLEEMTAEDKFYQASGWTDGSQRTFSFGHYGTQRYNFGTKTWSSSSGSVGYIDVSSSNAIGSSPFSDFKEFGYSTINEFLGTNVPQRSNDGFSDEAGQDFGIIVVDQGPNTISSFGEGKYGIAGNEIFLDQNPSLEGGLGVVAAIKPLNQGGDLQSLAQNFLDEVKEVLKASVSANQESTKVGWHGVPEAICWDSRDDENIGSENESNGPSEEEVNETAQEYCDAYDSDKWEITRKARTLKGTNPGVVHPNKQLHTFDIQWSLANDNNTLYYLDDNSKAQGLAYNNTRSVSVPYLDKISFSLINDFYELNGKMHLLENVSINVLDGKLTTTYTFSQKVQSPDFAGVFGGKVAFQNMVR